MNPKTRQRADDLRRNRNSTKTRERNSSGATTTLGAIGRKGIAGVKPLNNRSRNSLKKTRAPRRLETLNSKRATNRDDLRLNQARAKRGAGLSPLELKNTGGKNARGREGFGRNGSRSGRGHVDHHRSHGSHLSFGLFFGGGGLGVGVGYRSGHYYGGNRGYFGFGFGGGPCYTSSYLHAGNYSPYWNRYYWGGPTPYHLGYAYPSAYRRLNNNFGYHARYHFGYSYYHPYSRYSPYPFYRSSYYEPYYLSYGPAIYRTYYYTSYRRPSTSVVYIETSDPYVDEVWEDDYSDDYYDDDTAGFEDEEVLELETVVKSTKPGTATFGLSYSENVPLGLSYDEYLAWGEEALFDGNYTDAAEAFRRAAKLRWEDDYPKFQMGLALFASRKYAAATQAIEFGLDQNPAWLHRRINLSTSFSSTDEFAKKLSQLEQHIVSNESDTRARYCLGYVYYFSGNLFGARSVFKNLIEAGQNYRHLESFEKEANRRIAKGR